MRTSSLTLALALALATSPAAARDRDQTPGYTFQPEPATLQYTMQWTFVDSQKELEAAMRAEGIPTAERDGDPIMDNVRYSRSAGYCRALIISPTRKLDAEVMLHVQLHCIYGDWHKSHSTGPRGAG